MVYYQTLLYTRAKVALSQCPWYIYEYIDDIYSLFCPKIFALSNGAVSLRSLPARGSPSHRRKCQRRSSSVTNIALFSNIALLRYSKIPPLQQILLFSRLKSFFIKLDKSVLHKNIFFWKFILHPLIETDVRNWIFSQICLIPLWTPPLPHCKYIGEIR